MKKKIFVLLVCMLLLSLGTKTVYAAGYWYGNQHGATSNYVVEFKCEITPGENTSVYDLKIVLTHGDIYIDYFVAVDSNGKESRWGNVGSFSLSGNTYTASGYVVDNAADIQYFKLYFKHSFDTYSTVYNVSSSMVYTVEPTSIPEETLTPEPTVTSTPVPTATSTPKPTSTPVPTATSTPKPTSTPVPTPTNTPIPTPTNTPTPSPTPGPILKLNAYLDDNNAVAEYQTGGCTPIKSVIALYDVPDREYLGGSVVEQEVFLSGSGVMSELVVPGKLYRYKLTYMFVRDNIQFTEFIWSDILEHEDHGLDEYKRSGNISNFRELVYFIWNDFLEIELNVEGFVFSIKFLFFWLIIATLLLAFVFKYVFKV